MSNSKLVDYTRISPNKTSPRRNTIKKITIHHMAGNLSVETCGNVFAPSSRQASSNYGIDTDGRVGMYVEEKDRAWTSSSPENDNQAVTIEVANDQIGGNWHVSDKAYNKLIDLCVDICQRNGIKKLNFTGDKTGNLTMHCYFASTSCPGPYLKSKFPDIAAKVNARLAGNTSSDTTKNNTLIVNPKSYTKTQFIEEIAKYVKKYASTYGIKVYSPIIAQACLESAYGTSDKATYFNFFGMKYRANRVKCHCGYFNADSKEQLSNGSYVPTTTDWYAFDSIENGVKGYFEFINIDRYANVKGVTDPKTYLENLRNDGYATSLSYVTNLMNVISSNNLTKYDANSTVSPTPSSSLNFGIGDEVYFSGNTHYTSASAAAGKSCTSGMAKVTAVYANGIHKFHIRGSNGCTAYGWVDEKFLTKKTGVTTGNLWLRTGSGTNNSKIAVMSKGTKVFIMETLNNGWYKVYSAQLKKVGYCSGDYISV